MGTFAINDDLLITIYIHSGDFIRKTLIKEYPTIDFQKRHPKGAWICSTTPSRLPLMKVESYNDFRYTGSGYDENGNINDSFQIVDTDGRATREVSDKEVLEIICGLIEK